MTFYSFIADAILLLHAAFVAFILIGFITVWTGFILGWRFVRNFWFRIAHLLAMGFVAVEAASGRICPLTIWEERLRLRAGEGSVYGDSFVQHWVDRLLFYEISQETFAMVYGLFFLAVLATLWIVKPRPPAWPRLSRAGPPDP